MKKILFVTPNDISDKANGGNIVSKRNLSVLIAIFGSDNITCLQLLTRKDKAKPIASLKERLHGYFAGLTVGELERILMIADEYDYIFLDTSLYGKLAKELKQAGYHGTIITFYHNIEYVFYRNLSTLISMTYPLTLYPIRKVEKEATTFSDLNITLNKRDASKLHEYYNGKSTLQLPVSLGAGTVSGTNRTHIAGTPVRLLFLGSAFFANIHGIKWFIENVFPWTKANLVIAGKGMECLASYIASKKLEGISLHGYVEDIGAMYENADAVVLPIFEGSGMKVKTCEALKYGKLVLGTDEALTGYGSGNEDYLKHCNTREEFISCINILTNKTYKTFSEESRGYFLLEHETDKIVVRLKDCLSSMGSRSKHR